MFLIILSGIYACEEGQIDINTATLTELDEIYGIGPVKAQSIIDSRPFDSVNDLIKVTGIGEITLDKIIDQGLVCVTGNTPLQNSEEEASEEETINDSDNKDVEIINENSLGGGGGEEGGQNLNPSIIQLNTPKDIKSEDNIKRLDKADYAKYGFVSFCILIGVLLILKNKRKNEIA